MNKLLGKKILIVDDEELLREILSEFFTLEGAVTCQAKSGDHGFELLKKQKFDIVISDVRMPQGDGISLLERVKTQLHYQPIVYLYSGNSDPLKQERAESLGVAGFFIKPFSIRELIDILTS